MNQWLGEFYEQYRDQFFLAAWVVLRRQDLAEDAVHTAFQRLLRLRQKPQYGKAYILRAVRNAAVDLKRASTRQQQHVEAMQTGADGFTPRSQQIAANEAFVELERLDEDTREIIMLRIYGSLSFQEIADLTQAKLPTVASRYRRGILKIQSELYAGERERS